MPVCYTRLCNRRFSDFNEFSDFSPVTLKTGIVEFYRFSRITHIYVKYVAANIMLLYTKHREDYSTKGTIFDQIGLF